MKTKNHFLILLGIIFLGGFLRLYKLDWGEGYFFHPDEYHIVGSVNQLKFPTQMNPHFFSYGTFSTYLIYFTKLILTTLSPRFQNLNVFLLGRFYSALFSTLTIFVVYLISKKLFKEKVYSYLTAYLTAATPGLIQQAHFATPESALIFWLFLTLYLVIKWIDEKKHIFLFLSAVSLGFAIATKVVAAVFLPILLLSNFTNLKNKLGNLHILIARLLISTYLVLFTFVLIYPYSIIDFKSFRSSMNYEGEMVALGKQVVFYTRQFIDTITVIFQYQKIFPYALGPVVLVLGTLGFILAIVKIKSIDKKLIIILFAFFLYFIPNMLLFAKWTRFIAPAFPFFAIFTTYFVYSSLKDFTKETTYTSVIVNSIWAFMFFNIYLNHDVRVTASSWINQNIPRETPILTESRSMQEVPLFGNYSKITFDFYDLEVKPELQQKLPELLSRHEYFIVQSRRIFANHNEKEFPHVAKFYELLFSGKLGFEKIEEFTSYPRLEVGALKFEVKDEAAEETWSVFDHPVVRIYKKVKPLTENQYERLLKI